MQPSFSSAAIGQVVYTWHDMYTWIHVHKCTCLKNYCHTDPSSRPNTNCFYGEILKVFL